MSAQTEKPPTGLTPSELDNAQTHSVVLDCDDYLWEKSAAGQWVHDKEPDTALAAAELIQDYGPVRRHRVFFGFKI